MSLKSVTDGGLKRDVGTHSYTLYYRDTTEDLNVDEFGGSSVTRMLDKAIVHEYGADIATLRQLTSTRNELFGIFPV